MQLVVHAPFGSRLNRAWGLALRKRFCRSFNFELQAAALEDAGRYACERRQFGRPIIDFQGVGFMLADMATRTESARLLVHKAAALKDAGAPFSEAAAMAKAFVPEAANAIAGECIQIHGGVGFTWDADPHVHYRKAKQNDLLLGYNGIHRERVADLFLQRV